MRKKIITFITSTMLIFTLVPTFAFANETEPMLNEETNEEIVYEVQNTTDTDIIDEENINQTNEENNTEENNTEENDTEENDDEIVINGWYEENGNTYYYINNQYVTGLQTIEEKTYFFNNQGILQKGWITENGNKRYANKNGELVNGFNTINKDKYYFKNYIMMKKWQTINNYKYYFDSSGIMLTGLQTIGNSDYYFNNSGIMQTGIKKVNKNLYYFKDNGKAISKTGWVNCPDKKKRYFLGHGKMVTGVKKINKKLYFFNTKNGTLRKKGFFKYNNNEYYCKGQGVLATGWQALTRNKKLNGYYFSKKNGKMAKNTTIGHLKIPKSGKLHEAYARGIKKLNATHWSLKQAYINSYRLHYYDRWWRQKTSEKYAMRGFKLGKGNCYVMAATFYIQAKLLGYDVHQVSGKVNGWHPHSWTVIKQKGKEWIYDPNFRNETGRNGWKIYYGKSGTWRYSNYHKMN